MMLSNLGTFPSLSKPYIFLSIMACISTVETSKLDDDIHEYTVQSRNVMPLDGDVNDLMHRD
jgi:hypothetical protein